MANDSEILIKNVEAQLKRLLDQLSDLEEMKEEMDASEYDEEMGNTLEQVELFESSLKKMDTGALVSVAAKAQMAIQEAIRSSRDQSSQLFADMDAKAREATAKASKAQQDKALASNFVSTASGEMVMKDDKVGR
jgi:TATA-box binding protein (TBP) (component of TFIID and TFIIIB)